jgi:hypothetical protein
MAARMIRLDASQGCVVIRCTSCGYSTVRVTAESAQAAADRHRAQAHPRQATYAASKRRTRSTAST